MVLLGNSDKNWDRLCISNLIIEYTYLIHSSRDIIYGGKKIITN